MERATLEAYAGIAIGIMIWVLPATWWLKSVGLMVMFCLLVDISFRSPYTYNWSIKSKIIASIIGGFIMGSIGYNPINDQYIQDHKPRKAALHLLVTDFAACPFLPPYPPNSELITVWAKVDNVGAPSVAKDWKLSIIPVGLKSAVSTTFFSLGMRHDLVCGQIQDPSDALDLKTESKEIIGITRGKLGFVITGISPQILGHDETFLKLSVLDADGNEYSVTQRLADVGVRLISPQPVAPLTLKLQ